jgi:hypothetical protein
MTLPSSNPDAAERFQWRYERAIDEFKNGGSEIVLRASLYAIGYRGNVLEDEVNYQKCVLGIANKEKPADGFVSGLADKEW